MSPDRPPKWDAVADNCYEPWDLNANCRRVARRKEPSLLPPGQFSIPRSGGTYGKFPVCGALASLLVKAGR